MTMAYSSEQNSNDTHKLLVKMMWWDCMTERSSTLTGCVGHKMWCDKNDCQWQRLYCNMTHTLFFKAMGWDSLKEETVNSLTSYGSMRLPGRKKCAATHILLVMGYDVMRMEEIEVLLTFCWQWSSEIWCDSWDESNCYVTHTLLVMRR